MSRRMETELRSLLGIATPDSGAIKAPVLPCSRFEPACTMPRSVFELEWHAHFFAQTTCRTPPAVMVTW